MNNYRIKIIAVILMFIDHIYHILGSVYDVPIIFTWLGRLSAPLFFYMVAEGMYHTRNPKKMLIRLYLASVGMELLNLIYNSIKPEYGYFVRNGIFQTLFLVALYIFFIQQYRKQDSQEGKRKVALWMCIPVGVNVLIMLLNTLLPIPLLKYSSIVFPLLLSVEGSFVFVMLGIGFFIYREQKKAMIIFYSAFSAIFFLPALGELTVQNIFFENFQWMMIFSLPIILSYNGKKGKSLKYFFYVFYPAHIYLLTLIQLFAASKGS